MMIGCFPDPHPDELLYSACARHGDRMRYPNRADVVKELFVSSSATAVLELPNRLNYLVENLPSGHLYTTDLLIDGHTLFPLYAPFLSMEAAQRVRSAMTTSGRNLTQTYLGLATDHIGRPDQLRFCPVCLLKDRESHGEAYWHRVHQINGVEVCPSHAVFLETSDVHLANRSYPNAFTSIEESVKNVTPRFLNLEDRRHNLLLKLARDAAWLLNWRGPYHGSTNLRNRYFDLLLQQGYAFYSGRLQTRKLLKDFLSFFPPGMLECFRCTIKERGLNWLQRLVIKIYAEAFRHPLRHLLLMTFLGRTAEQIFTSFEESKPFGDGPWPCLNKAADHFRQLAITNCKVDGVCYREAGHTPRGTFTCSCGFVYVRLGPDRSQEDRFRLTRVASYGHVWDDKLRELWHSPIPLEEVGLRLNVSRCAIKWQVRRLSFPSIREMPLEAIQHEDVSASKAAELHTVEMALGARRREWLDHFNVHPGASRSELTITGASLYKWLKEHDGEWVEAHLPSNCTPPPPPKRLDYGTEDKKLAKDIVDAARKIINQPGLPVRITITAIIREVGRGLWISVRDEKFPRTARAIAKHTESMETFSLRRVQWAESYYSTQGICPKRYQFIEAGHINLRASETPCVRVAIDAALERLKLRFGTGVISSLNRQATKVA